MTNQKSHRKDLHLYQELCPVSPMVASSLAPAAFLKKLTDGSIPIVLPKLLFVELKLGELATNPISGSAENLPYPNIVHFRDCLEIIKGEYEKHMKTVNRLFTENFSTGLLIQVFMWVQKMIFCIIHIQKWQNWRR